MSPIKQVLVEVFLDEASALETIMADLPNFTNIEPVVQISEVMI